MTVLVWPTPASHTVSQPLAGTWHNTTGGEPQGYAKRDAKGPVAVRLDAAPGFAYQQYCHRGVDISIAKGLKVLAGLAGRVVEREYNAVRGNLVTVAAANGWRVRNQHLSAFSVALGATVAADQVVGLSGSSGQSTGPHDHCETWRIEYGEPVFYNPERLVAGGDLAHLLDEPAPVAEDEMTLTQYLPLYKAIVAKGYRIRSDPSTAHDELRTLTNPESWELLGVAKGQLVNGSDAWYVRVNGLIFEFVHSGGVSGVTAPPVTDCSPIQAKLDAANAQIANALPHAQATVTALSGSP